MRHSRWIGCAAALALVGTACSSGPGTATGEASSASQNGVVDAGKPPPPPLDAGMPPPPPMDAGMPQWDGGCAPGCELVPLGDGKTCTDWGTLKTEGSIACSARGETLSNLSSVIACCDMGASLAQAECCPNQPPPPPKCEMETLGDGKTCLDPNTEKQDAVDLCTKLGLDVQSTSQQGVSKLCPGGTLLDVTCCPATMPPPQCQDFKLLGSGMSGCLDPSTEKQQAADLCSKANLLLTGITPEDATKQCPGGTWADVQCCPAPPPPKCEDETLGDGKTCLDPSTVKTEAAAICAKLNLTLSSIALEGGMNGGCPTLAQISCCAN